MEHKTTVFIADSGEDFASGLTAALQHTEGFEVLGTACDGEQAARMVLRCKPDILVLDLMLPKQDGLSVLKSISGMEHPPKVLATSVFMTEYISSAAAGLGIQYLMLKPCDTDALVDRLNEIRGGESLRDSGLRRLDKANIETMVTSIIH